MRKTLTPPLAVVALLLATVIAIAPRPALAAESPEEIAEALFGEDYEQYVEVNSSDTAITLIAKAGATFQSNASVTIGDKPIALMINATISAPETPITISGNGSFTIDGGGDITGENVCFKVVDDASLEVVSLAELSGVEVAGGKFLCSTTHGLKMNSLIVSGNESSTVEFSGAGRLEVENVTLSNTSKETTAKFMNGELTSITNMITQESFAGTLTLDDSYNSYVDGNASFSGGIIELSGDTIIFGHTGMLITGATVDIQTEAIAPKVTVKGGTLKLSEGGEISCPVFLEDAVESGYSTLELAGGINNAYVEMNSPSAVINYTKAPDNSSFPIRSYVYFQAGEVNINAGGALSQYSIAVGSNCTVNVDAKKINWMNTQQAFNVSGGKLNI